MLIAGAWLRLANATGAPFLEIERNEFVPAAMTISWDHHPARMLQHGAVPAYLIRLSALIFGESHLGLRMMGIIAGTATIVIVYLLAERWWGGLAGLLVAGALSIERYHATISARAIDLPFDLFFIAVAMFCFSAFLRIADEPERRREAARWLYGTAIASALGFLCKELTALLVPVLFLSFILTRNTGWLRRPAPWLAAGLYLLIIAPDVYSSLTATPATRMDLLSRQVESMRHLGVTLDSPEEVADGYFMSYGDQLSRFRSFGFNIEPFYFYFGTIYDRMGFPHENNFDEFPFMHPVLACTLWAGVAVALVRRRKDRLTVFLLAMFVLMLTPFALVQMGAPRGAFPSDSQMLWYWSDRSMLPAMLLTGSVVASLFGALAPKRWWRPRSNP